MLLSLLPLSRGIKVNIPGSLRRLLARSTAWLYHCAPRIGDGMCRSFFSPTPPRHSQLLRELNRRSFCFALFPDTVFLPWHKGDAGEHLPRRTSSNGLLRLWQIVIQEFQQPPTSWSVCPARGDHIGAKYPGLRGLFNLDIGAYLHESVMYVEIKHATDGLLNHKRAILSHRSVYSHIIMKLSL